MKENITQTKIDAVHKAQELAKEKFCGDDTTTELRLWDDGDFIVEVCHGFEDKREKIIYRSSESRLCEEKAFMYRVERVVDPESFDILENNPIT